MVALGDPRGSLQSEPTPSHSAACGTVDLFDFPLDPPDGDGARGGTDFGIYRSRFNGYHTGEDWGIGYGSSLGSPVHAIGHGMVSYAAPLGWGADQGVIVIGHILTDGRVLYSFYGHLDPPSVVLWAGQCVARGDEIGRIGRPRTPPHLHFEIRVHFPTAPGPGYWSIDPTLAGWLPPSQTIWQSRLVGAPGVRWVRPSTAGLSVLGSLSSYVLVATEGDRLVGIDLRDGTLLWQLPVEQRARNALLDASSGIIYLVGWLGDVTAWQLANADVAGQAEATLLPLWEIDLGTAGTPHLMPLSRGGVAVSIGEELFGLSAAGDLLWQHKLGARVVEWAADDARLVFTTARPGEEVWAVDAAGPHRLATGVGGRPVIAGEDLFLYTASGVYRLDVARGAAELIYPLPAAYLPLGDMVALPDGELMVAQTDRQDRRLIVLQPDGVVRWERSVAGIHAGRPRLVLVEGRPYVLFEKDGTYAGDIALMAIDTDHKELIRILDGGTRYPRPQETWAFPLGEDQLVLNLAGGHLLVLDVAAAEETMRRLNNTR
jgi:murein DD-endopeptidase MepM/ murein hydrolase activator NlpD